MTTSVLSFYYEPDGGAAVEISMTAGDNMRLISYDPQTGDGKFITESARVDLTGTTAQNTATIRTLNKLFVEARGFAKSGVGKRIFVLFGTSTDKRRSLLVDGNVSLNEGILGPWQYNTRMRVTIEWTRLPFWEGAETAITLTNASESSTEIEVKNALDATHENWVGVEASGVTGDLPAPVKLTLTNTKAGSDPAQDIFVYHNVFSYPSNVALAFEGESATQEDSTLTSTVDATCSEGDYGKIDWESEDEELLVSWTISKTQLSYLAGGHFAAMLRWAEVFPYSDCFLRLALAYDDGTLPASIWRGSLFGVTSGHELTMLETFRLPPYLYGMRGSSLQALDLQLYGYRNTTGTHTIKLDYLFLGPVAGDGSWNHFHSIAGVAENDELIHDQPNGFTYRSNASGIMGDVAVYGGPLMIVPNLAQRYYFLSEDNAGISAIAQTFDVQLSYRPRYKSL